MCSLVSRTTSNFSCTAKIKVRSITPITMKLMDRIFDLSNNSLVAHLIDWFTYSLFDVDCFNVLTIDWLINEFVLINHSVVVWLFFFTVPFWPKISHRSVSALPRDKDRNQRGTPFQPWSDADRARPKPPWPKHSPWTPPPASPTTAPLKKAKQDKNGPLSTLVRTH